MEVVTSILSSEGRSSASSWKTQFWGPSREKCSDILTNFSN